MILVLIGSKEIISIPEVIYSFTHLPGQQDSPPRSIYQTLNEFRKLKLICNNDHKMIQITGAGAKIISQVSEWWRIISPKQWQNSKSELKFLPSPNQSSSPKSPPTSNPSSPSHTPIADHSDNLISEIQKYLKDASITVPGHNITNLVHDIRKLSNWDASSMRIKVINKIWGEENLIPQAFFGEMADFINFILTQLTEDA